jgi:hypothetical protein
MSSECLTCGAKIDDAAPTCSACGREVPKRDPKPVRKRLSIPFACITGIGIAGALVAGGGKRSAAHANPPRQVITASLDGKRVELGGPSIALLERSLESASPPQQGEVLR